MTTNTTTVSVLAETRTTGSVSHNHFGPGSIGASGNASMTNSMGGMGILSAQQNTGAAALQQQSVSLGSMVGGNGGGLAGFGSGQVH